MQGQREPSFFDSKVPYDMEKPGAYIESYHLTSQFDICDVVVDLLHHADGYISPIQAWIEEAYGSSCQFGKQFDDVLYAYDLPSISPNLTMQVCTF